MCLFCIISYDFMRAEKKLYLYLVVFGRAMSYEQLIKKQINMLNWKLICVSLKELIRIQKCTLLAKKQVFNLK